MTMFDVLLPSQFFPARRKQAPEQRLMIAVLHDALNCIEKHRLATNDHERRLFRDAERWFNAEELDWPYSFESICGILELDSRAVRHRLRLFPHQASAARQATRTIAMFRDLQTVEQAIGEDV